MASVTHSHQLDVAMRTYREGWQCAECPHRLSGGTYDSRGRWMPWRDCTLRNDDVALCPGVRAEDGR